MAFYLKRAFQDKEDIFVINDLRLEMNDDVAQIDHLIIHRFGFTIVESKSVTSKISINEFGEWTRHYPKYTRGMPSPVNQAKRQADFLKNFLMARSEYLLRKKLVFKASISDFKFDVLVAISDSGIINRAKNTEIPEVHKADQISETLKSLLSGYAGTNKSILTLKVNYRLADSSMEKITNYLLQSHKPKSTEQVDVEVVIKDTNQVEETVAVKEPVLVETTDIKITPEIINNTHSVKNCSKCNSENIEITYGKYGYYFKCRDCKGNTSIKLKCKDSSCKPRIKKKKNYFYEECASCKKSELYFINKPIESTQEEVTS
jgi:transposase-like protein